MKVKMKVSSAGPAGVRQSGKVYDVPDDEGTALIAGDYAEEPAAPVVRDPSTVEDMDPSAEKIAELEEQLAASTAMIETLTKERDEAVAKAAEVAEQLAAGAPPATPGDGDQADKEKPAETGTAPPAQETATDKPQRKGKAKAEE